MYLKSVNTTEQQNAFPLLLRLYTLYTLKKYILNAGWSEQKNMKNTLMGTYGQFNIHSHGE